MYKLLSLSHRRLRTLSEAGADPVLYLCPSRAVHRRPMNSPGQHLPMNWELQASLLESIS